MIHFTLLRMVRRKSHKLMKPDEKKPAPELHIFISLLALLRNYISDNYTISRIGKTYA